LYPKQQQSSAGNVAWPRQRSGKPGPRRWQSGQHAGCEPGPTV